MVSPKHILDQIYASYSQKQLSKNTILAISQALTSIAVMIIAYRLLVSQVGLELIGFWSLILAYITMMRIADFTGSAALGRFVALKHDIKDEVIIIIHTTLISMFFFYTLSTTIIWFSADTVLNLAIPNDWNSETKIFLLPLIIHGLWALPFASALSGCLDGLNRADLRAKIIISGNIIFLISVIFTIPHYGLMGWACSLIMQQIYVSVGCWLVLRGKIDNLGYLPYKWSYRSYVSVLSLGIKMQVISALGLLVEPVVKFTLNNNGGLSSVAIYELAMRLITAIRNVAVQGTQPLLAEFTMAFSKQESTAALLQKSTRLVAKLSAVMIVTIIAISPIYSVFMFNALNYTLISYSIILALGVAFNIIALPYYFVGISINRVKYNIISQLALCATIIIFSYTLQQYFGSIVVIFGISAAYALGGLIIILGNRSLLKQSA